ncbi:MAG TPA: arginine--tRNA ligase [Polyangiaceae bacterium]|jgi:arginyl-tRNA synthetase|nr:MAG: Arginine--tRNA ligase [Deltaproteobacteria bacterium ADurb.Bin207]HNZ23905.1 arginine--tRNA ligase [Polyangiaceae bacterium]HOE49725.1 arginine--tRNA ligase [Polyangiaceae bacterium]HOH01753.1 arginine--tRNA ligase [Polyangiaceae bacterium]HOR35661.1 arginine--tRNA ligase [Polyangiaceae bacterium]
MCDPQSILHDRVREALVVAFGAEMADADPMVRPSDRADFQANVALGLSKRLKRPPRQIAEALVSSLRVEDVCERVEVSGPGFINLTLKNSFLGECSSQQLRDPRLLVSLSSQPETVVIDYSAPNVAKEMHVGHLRSTILGDALARILSSLGHHVIRQNHLGDWGTPFGMLIEHLVDLGEQRASEELGVGDLNKFYREARAKFEQDPSFADRSRLRVVQLQAGDEPTRVLWQRLVHESKRYFGEIYAQLDVSLTDEDVCGESFYNPMLADVAEELEQRGLATVDDGALCIFVPGFSSREGSALPLIVRKTDGGYGYAATDLAAVRHRVKTLGATRLLYVVGAPQRQHLSMVFSAATMAGWLCPPARAEHVEFGSVLGADGKMFKTRAGDTIKLSDLIQEGVERALAEVTLRFPELDDETRRRVARQVGVGALKYADLSNDRVKDYVFDFDRMLKFEGNTGGYIQYAHARCRSILRHARLRPEPGPIEIVHPAERTLALVSLRLGAVIHQVAETLQPHTLCSYLFELAGALSGFWHDCPVLKADSELVRDSRLRLVELTSRILDHGLGLLGIQAPERM